MMTAHGPRAGKPGRSRLTAGAFAVLALLVTACVAACSGASTSPTPSKPSAERVACPNPEGGSCLDELSPDRVYATEVFTPQLAYRVPVEDWYNYEDTPGNFLLVPPGNDLRGVNAGTSDFIGVYTSVTPAVFTDPNGCVVAPVPGIEQTPEGMSAWFEQQAELLVSEPEAVTVGGLDGVLIDMRTRPDAVLPSCHEGPQEVSVAGLFTGLPPSSLDHGTIPRMTMRLYLLAYGGGVLAIEVDDIDDAPGDLDTMSDVVRDFEFTS